MIWVYLQSRLLAITILQLRRLPHYLTIPSVWPVWRQSTSICDISPIVSTVCCLVEQYATSYITHTQVMLGIHVTVDVFPDNITFFKEAKSEQRTSWSCGLWLSSLTRCMVQSLNSKGYLLLIVCAHAEHVCKVQSCIFSWCVYLLVIFSEVTAGTAAYFIPYTFKMHCLHYSVALITEMADL